MRCAWGLLLCLSVSSQNCSGVAGGGCVATATCVSENVCKCQGVGVGDGTLGDYTGRGCHTGSGQLTYLGMVNKANFGGDLLRGVVQSPDGKNVYVGGGLNIYDLTRDPVSGALKSSSTLPFRGDQGDIFLAIDPEGNNVYSVGSASSSVFTYRRAVESGSLTMIDEQDGLISPVGMVLSPDGRNAYIGNFDRVMAYQRGTNGSLNLTDTYREGVDGIAGLSKINHLVMSSDGLYLYLTAPGNQSVVVFQRDPGSGKLQQIQTVKQGDESTLTCLSNPHHIVASQDGRNVYVTDFGTIQSVANFRRIADGRLAFEQCLTVSVAYSLIASPDDHMIYVLGSTSILHLDRDPGTGRLSESSRYEGPSTLGTLTFAVITPDGRHLYASDGSKQSVAMFGRDALDICSTTPFPDGYVNLSDSTSGVCARGFSCAVQLGCAPGFDRANASVTCPDQLVSFQFSGCSKAIESELSVWTTVMIVIGSMCATTSLQAAAMDCDTALPWPHAYASLMGKLRVMNMQTDERCQPSMWCWGQLVHVVQLIALVEAILLVSVVSLQFLLRLTSACESGLPISWLRLPSIKRLVLFKIAYAAQWLVMIFALGLCTERAAIMTAGNTCVDVSPLKIVAAWALVVVNLSGIGLFMYLLHTSWIVRQVIRYRALQSDFPSDMMLSVMGTWTEEHIEVSSPSHTSLKWELFPKGEEHHYAWIIGRLSVDHPVTGLLFIVARQLLTTIAFLFVRVSMAYCIVSIAVHCLLVLVLARWRLFRPTVDMVIAYMISIATIIKFIIALVLLRVAGSDHPLVTVLLVGIAFAAFLSPLRIACTGISNVWVWFKRTSATEHLY